MGGFRPSAIAGRKTPGSIKQGGRAGAPVQGAMPRARSRISPDRPLGQLEAGVNPSGARARRRAARAGLPDAGVRRAARQPGVPEILEA